MRRAENCKNHCWLVEVTILPLAHPSSSLLLEGKRLLRRQQTLHRLERFRNLSPLRNQFTSHQLGFKDSGTWSDALLQQVSAHHSDQFIGRDSHFRQTVVQPTPRRRVSS